MERLQCLIGLIFFILFAYLISSNRNKVNFGFIFKSLGIQALLTFLLLGLPVLNIDAPLFFIFDWANTFINSVIQFTDKGTEFLFGSLIDRSKHGVIVAIQVLPTIIFFSSLSAVLYHLKILPFIINMLSIFLRKTLKVSGAETLSVVANIFVGQTEAPLVVKPFLKSMTQSELFAVMVGGMATVAGGVMASYVAFLSDSIPNIAGHLMVASVVSAPAALMFSKIMFPETEVPLTLESLPKQVLVPYENVIDAAASGASEGLSLMANVAAMLLAFIALIFMLDSLLMNLGDLVGFASWGQYIMPESLKYNGEVKLTLSFILSWIFVPFAFLLGLEPSEVFRGASLLGKKVAFNEFISYLELSKHPEYFTERSRIILSYALCGFANFCSIAIQVGGIGALVPERRKDLAKLGIKSVIAGSLATFTTACFAGLVI